MTSQRGFKRWLTTNAVTIIAPDCCRDCEQPAPCRHVTVTDPDGHTWILTAREWANMSRPIPPGFTHTTQEDA